MSADDGCPCNSMNPSEEGGWSRFCIGEMWIFSGLTAEELSALAATLVRHVFQAGDAVFRQGEPARSIFLIKSGRIRLSRMMENGTELILDIRKPGDYLGEYILNDMETAFPYPVTASCVEQTVTCGFTKSSFERMILKHPAMGLTVIRNMAGRIANLTERIEAMSQTHLEEKLYGVLLNVAREHGRKGSEGSYVLDMPLTHEDLGFLVGAHRVSVTRIMKRLKETGRVAHDGRTLVVRGEGDVLPN
ncbi:MAG: Crp/Fnr family transcriptional regulator [Deltaproteobacteria bacterium]|jgi:CRP/FNR family transcriptional regulator|nr:Crp/Fnr family transcriptional regulator [Deltaproteobacteria bacterium]